MINSGMTILYVSDQETARRFYETVLQTKPSLDVPGMTEFRFECGFVLGLMPKLGIKHLLGPDVFSGAETKAPRVELYLQVDDAESYLNLAMQNGAKHLLDVEMRGWGDRVGYCLDPDNHVVAFAEASE